MKAKLLLLLSVVTLLTTSCSYEFYCKRCPVTTTHTIEIKDTTIIKEILKDTTITVYLPADSVITILVVECDSMGLAQMQKHIIQHKNMVATLKIENGILTQNITHLLDSLEITIQYKEIEITRLKERVEHLEQTKVEREKYIPKFVKVFAWIGGVVVMLVLLLLLYNVTGIIRNPFGWVRNLM